MDLPSRIRARLVGREIAAISPESLIDIGCGTGSYSFYFSRAPSVRVLGVDTNQARVADCKAIAQRIGRCNVSFVCGSSDLVLRNLEAALADAIVAIEVLELFPDTRLALLEMFRVLKPGGYLIGHVAILGCLREFAVVLLDDNSLRQLLTEAGFQILTLRATFGGPIRKLCRAYARISRFRALAALLFPLLLSISALFPIENEDGDYRLFVARKPENG